MLNITDNTCSEMDTSSYIPEREESKKGWTNHWKNVFIKNKFNLLWIPNKKIIVSRSPEVEKEASQYAVRAINNLIDDVGLDFIVEDVGQYSNLRSEQIKRSLTYNKTPIKMEKFFDVLDEEKITNFERPLEIILTERRITNRRKSLIEGFAASGSGIAMVHIDKHSRNKPYFQRNGMAEFPTAKHEAAHLLLFHGHHKDIPGYKEAEGCNMDRNGSYKTKQDSNGIWRAYSNLCDPCLDRLKYIWKGLENYTGRKFLKTKK